MKYLFAFLSILIFGAGIVVGQSVGPRANAQLTVQMQAQAESIPVIRTYMGITSWSYTVVNGKPQMKLGFINPTVYRCGFEI